jgi:hypothetical protein
MLNWLNIELLAMIYSWILRVAKVKQLPVLLD